MTLTSMPSRLAGPTPVMEACIRWLAKNGPGIKYATSDLEKALTPQFNWAVASDNCRTMAVKAIGELHLLDYVFRDGELFGASAAFVEELDGFIKRKGPAGFRAFATYAIGEGRPDLLPLRDRFIAYAKTHPNAESDELLRVVGHNTKKAGRVLSELIRDGVLVLGLMRLLK